MLSAMLIFKVMLLITSTSSNGVFRFNANASVGNPIYYFYTENSAQCLRACYEESNCTAAEYYDEYEGKKGYCRLSKEGATRHVAAYVLSRGVTDSSCMTETIVGDISFQKIPYRENVAIVNCTKTQDVTGIQLYYRHFHPFFLRDTDESNEDWTKSEFKLILTRNNFHKELLFSKKSEETCTSVPIFHKADYHRLFFGEIYNVTGYYFYNAYAFADYCVSPTGECLGVHEIQEYKDDHGFFFYDDPGRKNMNDSDLGQRFFIAGKETSD